MTIDNKALLNTMAEKYRLAERLVFAKMKPWQQAAVTEDRATGKSSGILDQFCKDVIKMAENMVIAPPDAKPPVATSSAPPVEVPQWHNKNGANGYDEDQDIYQ